MYLLGVRIDNISMDEALQKIQGFLEDGQQHYIVTPNPDFLLKAREDEEFKEILNKSDLSLPDGVGLIFASWFLSEPLKGRVVGVDLVKKIISIYNTPQPLLNNPTQPPLKLRGGAGGVTQGGAGELRIKIFLLGGYNGAAEKIARDWSAVVGFCEDADTTDLFARIRQCQPDILLIGLGAPRQEKWIVENLSKLPSVKVAIGVGSALNLLAGQTKRAPKIFQALGLEWLWRLFLEPRRWHKVWRSVVIFPLLMIKSVFSNS